MKIYCSVCGKERDQRGRTRAKSKLCRACFYKSLLRPLKKEEIQENWLGFVNVENQIQDIKTKPYRGRNIRVFEWKVEVVCPECQKKRMVGVNYIREKSKKKNATLFCIYCKNRIKKGRAKNTDGYMWVNVRTLPRDWQEIAKQMKFRGKNMILEHRIVMAMKMGRPLLSNEIVRHMNGNKTDNRPENLELGSHSENMRDHSSSFLENKILRGFIKDLGYDPEQVIAEKRKDIEIVKRKRTH